MKRIFSNEVAEINRLLEEQKGETKNPSTGAESITTNTVAESSTADNEPDIANNQEQPNTFPEQSRKLTFWGIVGIAVLAAIGGVYAWRLYGGIPKG